MVYCKVDVIRVEVLNLKKSIYFKIITTFKVSEWDAVKVDVFLCICIRKLQMHCHLTRHSILTQTVNYMYCMVEQRLFNIPHPVKHPQEWKVNIERSAITNPLFLTTSPLLIKTSLLLIKTSTLLIKTSQLLIKTSQLFIKTTLLLIKTSPL